MNAEKQMASEAVAAAPKAGDVASGKSTVLHSPEPGRDASTFERRGGAI